MNSGILLIDDDPDILTILKDNLELDGYSVYTASTGREGIGLFETVNPRLIILDLSLPDIDGIQVCRRVREKCDVPIIMLTARDQVPDKVLGLESGADDYIVKPFDYLELAARVRACLRRSAASLDPADIIQVGPIRMEPSTAGVWKDGEKIRLTRRQYLLLLVLAKNAGRALTRRAIRKELWPEGDVSSDTRAIDVHIQHLRALLEDNPSEPTHIVTVPQVGYMMTV
ncbi:MAG: response regulator transcription factor [Pseudomonadota bacterium]